MAANPSRQHPAATLADQVLQAIQTAIVTGDLAPGSKLKEPELARLYGTSRGPLREAICRLEARGLVQLTPHSGARVTDLEHRVLYLAKKCHEMMTRDEAARPSIQRRAQALAPS